ncbi:MAG TPA: small multi-drug export protein [Oscillospiraceae bacterium]|nr:small multi-drug export protein [Oscillospiraceae bacterium]HPK34506.1 small multi-drug export protein [Oscillospiraceae bacterium]HPR74734.1 small multi-drug export protein [Oscillospiraceae bacterium]
MEQLTFLENCAQLPLIIKYLIVLAIGFVPVFEIRLAMVAGTCYLGLGIVETFIFGLIGNLLLIFPMVILGRTLIKWLETTKILGWFGRWMSGRTQKKMDRITTLTSIGLFFFVAIPVPGTGVFTGGLIASFMDVRLKKAFPSLAIGAAVAGIASMIIYALPVYAGLHGSTSIPWFR